MSYFEKVKGFLMDLNIDIIHEDAEEELVVVHDEENGISNLVIDCEDPILVFEQFIMDLKDPSAADLTSLLQINRKIVHGAFALDETGNRLLFRDTLQLENLDLNEIEGTLNAVSLMMAEHAEKLIEISHH